MEVNFLRVDPVVCKKILRQYNRFPRRCLSPIGELGRENDHLVIVVHRFRAKIFHHIGAHSLKVQTFPAGQCDEQCVRTGSIVTFRDITAEMNVAILFCVQNIVIHKTALHLFLTSLDCRNNFSIIYYF